MTSCRAAEATAAEARRKYEAAKLAADEAEKARLAAEGLNQEAQARKYIFHISTFLAFALRGAATMASTNLARLQQFDVVFLRWNQDAEALHTEHIPLHNFAV